MSENTPVVEIKTSEKIQQKWYTKKVIIYPLIAIVCFGTGFVYGYDTKANEVKNAFQNAFSNIAPNLALNNTPIGQPKMQEQPKPTTTLNKALNENVELTTIDFKITKVEELGDKVLKNPDYPKNEYINAKDNAKFVKLSFVGKNKTKEEIYDTALTDAFVIRDQNDTKFTKDSDATIYGIKQKEKVAYKLQPQIEYSGSIIFELPKTSTKYTIQNTSIAKPDELVVVNLN